MATGIEDLTARAKQLIAERSYQEAVRACRRVLLSRPDETPVRLLLGKALLALRRYDEVRAEMMAVLRIHPQEATAHRLLGESYLRSGDPHKARDCVLRALDLDPSDQEARELLVEIEEETAPGSATIDRWFDPEAVATVQTTSPPFQEEEPTGPVPHTAPFQEESSVEVDPRLTREALAATGRSGFGGKDGQSSRHGSSDRAGGVAAQRPGTPQRDREEPGAVQVRPAPHPAPRGRLRSSIPPPPASGPPRPGSAGPPRKATLRAPAAPPPPSSVPPPPRVPSFDEPYDDTAAHTPVAKRNAVRRAAEVTDELSLRDIDEVVSLQGLDEVGSSADSVDEFEGEPTQVHPERLGVPGEEPLDRVPVGRDPNPTPSPVPGIFAPPRFPDDPLPPPRGVAAEHGPPSRRPPPGPFRFPAQPHRPPPAAIPSAIPAATPEAPPVHPGTPRPHALQPLEHATPHSRTGVRPGSRAFLWVAVVTVPVLLGVSAFFGVRLWMESTAADEVRAAARQAGDDGLRSSLDAAIRVAEKHSLDDPEDLALRARLLATLVLEHGEDRAEDVQALLGRLEGDEANLPDARVAEAYLRLARGDVRGAEEALAAATGENAELWRARALVAEAANDLPRAVPAARAAVTDRPTSPRHVSLLALLMAMNRDTAAALEALGGVPEGDRSPAVRLARARILLESGSNPAGAASEAAAVLEDLGEMASPHQKAWAHLVRARNAAFVSGHEQVAREEAHAAAESRPTWDEGFALSLAEVFVEVGAPGDAQEVLSNLPEQSQEPQRRARLVAEVALANGDYAAAAAALDNARDDARTAFLRGRIQEVRGNLDEARELYERAMADPRESVRARARLGAIALDEGRPSRAVELLEPAREREPGNVAIVPVLVRALLATDRVERAEEVVRVALGLREDAPELLGAKAQVDLAQGDVESALATLREVVARRPDDPDVHASLGEAARLAGEAELARESFDRALELREDHPQALAGLAMLAVDAGDVEAAEQAIERADEAGARGPTLDRAKAQLLVLKGAGEEAIETLSELAEDSEDASLWTALGRAQLQAERDRDAMRSFQRALRLDDDAAEAHLGMALLQTRAGALSRVARSIGAAERTARLRNLGPRFEARIAAARGRLRFELGDFGDAIAEAREALEKDPDCSEAHLLLANVAIERGDDPVPHLRAAVEGRAPLPEALGRLAVRLPRGQEACDLARRYMRAAPEGYDAPDVRDVLARCR